MARRGQRSAVRRPVGLLALLLALAGSAVFAVATGAVEVFIDATRGAIQKIPIAVYSFKSAISVPGQFPADVLKADLRRSLRSEEHTSELQSRLHLVCRLLLEKKKKIRRQHMPAYSFATVP